MQAAKRKESTMTDTEKGVLTIRYVNGTIEKYEYGVFHEPGPSIGKYIEEALTRGYGFLRLENSTVLILQNNVLSIEISPSPSQLPGFVLEGVKRISESPGV